MQRLFKGKDDLRMINPVNGVNKARSERKEERNNKNLKCFEETKTILLSTLTNGNQFGAVVSQILKEVAT